MLFDSITLADGGNFSNLVVASGTSFPPVAQAGELFFRTDSGKMFVFVLTDWQEVSFTLGFTPLDAAGGTMTGSLVLNSDPTQLLGAATKQYVDNIATGLTLKAAVHVATTANITLSGLQTIDGVVLEVGDRVLVKNQTTATQNGIYVASASAWARSSDADNSPVGEVVSGMFTFVQEGTTLAHTGWVLATVNPITLDSTALSFVQFSGAASTGTITLGSTAVSLNGSTSTLAGLTSVGATSFTGNLTGNVTGTSSLASSLTGGSAGTIPYQSAAGSTAMLAAGTSGYVLTSNGAAAPSWQAASSVPAVPSMQIAFGSAGNTLTSTANFSYDNTANGRLFVGNTSGGQILGAFGGGSLTVSGGSSGSTASGALYLSGGVPSSGAGSPIVFSTSASAGVATERMRITANGGLAMAGAANYGTSGQVLTSNGDATPSWQTVSGVSLSGTNTWTATNTFSTLINATNIYGPAASTLNIVGSSSNSITQAPGNISIVAGANMYGTSLPGGTVAIKGGNSNMNAYVSASGGHVYISGGDNLIYNGGTSGNAYVTGGTGVTHTGNGWYGLGGHTIIAGGSGGGGGGNVQINGGLGSSAIPSGGYISISTGTTALTERFRILTSGAWSVGSTGTAYGTSGQVLTSAGAGSAPTWAAVPAAIVDASTLTGTTLASNVTSSSLASVGPILTVTGSNAVIKASQGAPASSITLHGGDGVGAVGGNATVEGGVGGTGVASGNAYLSGGTALGTSTGGNAYISGGLNANNGGGVGGNIILRTGPADTFVERLRILNNGAWSVGTGGTATGTSGQILTSTGASTPPTWQAPAAFLGGTLTSALTLAADPVSALQAATKQYVDSAVLGLIWKHPADTATTANITLSGLQTIDGITVVAGSRVLVKNQTLAAQNGVWVAAASAWARATDFDQTAPIDEINSAAIFVSAGTTQANTAWTESATVVTVGTDAITFTQFSAAGSYTAGSNLVLTGNSFALNSTLTGLTSVGATTFTGNLTGNVTGNVSGSAASITGTYGGSLTSLQITTGLGFTPYNSTNPSGYISSITSGNVTTALGFTPYNATNPSGYLNSINSSQVTTALGFTPYNATNPSGYISSITSGNVTTALGFTPYNATNPSGYITSAGNAATATTASTANALNTANAYTGVSFSTTGGSAAQFGGAANVGVYLDATNLAIRCPGSNGVYIQNATGSATYGIFSTTGLNMGSLGVTAGTFTGALSGTATYVSATQQANAILGKYASTAMVLNDSTNSGSFICRATSTTGDSNLAGMTFWHDAYALRMGVRSDGTFGIGGWSSAAWRWYSDASGNMVASGNVTAYSDPRLKENFARIANPLEMVCKLDGGTFNWKSGIAHTAVKAGKRDYGILADQVEAIMPEIVSPSIEIDGEIYKTVDYSKLVPLLIEAVKELKAELDALKAGK